LPTTSSKLDLYDAEALESCYGLFKTGDASTIYAATTGNLIHLITILSTIHSINEVELESDVENAVAHQ